ncbi:MAG: ATP-binding protein [Elusimicrobia bacterium]|nr:ATP-binding protein [Elusimicrobiota bacterium]
MVLTGPRQSGKSTLLKKVFPSYDYITLDDTNIRLMAKTDPALFIENLNGRAIIDEIQYAPELLPHIKISVDRNRSKNGRFILTGSQIFPLIAGISESLAGRAALFELLGFSWEELKTIPKNAKDCYKQIFRGFYPVPAIQKIDIQTYYGSYISTYLERDIRQIQTVQDISVFQSFLQLLAARAGALLSLNNIANECGISHTTAKRWLSLLETTRIIYLLKPYSRNITKRIVKNPKLYFTDTGLLTYLLKYPNADTLMAGPQAGAFFENMLVIELLKQKFNHNFRCELYFYRDSNGNEADIILDFGNKQIPIEIKSSKNLHPKFANFINHIPFKDKSAYLLSFVEHEIRLTQNVKAMPWWKFNPSKLY